MSEHRRVSLGDALTLAAVLLVGLLVYSLLNVDTDTLREWAEGMGLDAGEAAGMDRPELLRWIGGKLLETLALVAGTAWAFNGIALRLGVGAAAAGPLGMGAAVLITLLATKVGGVVDDILGRGVGVLSSPPPLGAQAPRGDQMEERAQTMCAGHGGVSVVVGSASSGLGNPFCVCADGAGFDLLTGAPLDF